MKNGASFLKVSAIIVLCLSFARFTLASAEAEMREILKKEGLTTEQISKIVAKLPNAYSGVKIQANIDWLKTQGVKDVGKVVVKFPPVLGLSISESLEPRVKWLKEQGVKDVGKVISSLPPILGLSISEQLEPKAKWLKEQGVKNVGKVISGLPPILGLSISEKLDPKVKWFKKQGMKDVGKVMSAFPAILSYSISDNLEPKLREFTQHWGVSMIELESSPMLFGASLSRLQDLRIFLEQVGLLSDGRSFKVANIPNAQKTRLLKTGSAETLFEHLKAIGAISPERHSLFELTRAERQVLAKFYHSSEFSRILESDGGMSSSRKAELSCFLDALRREL